MIEKPKLHLACIVLAAGSASRFGGAKLRHALPSGLTVIEQTIALYLKVFSDIAVVVREGDAYLQAHIKPSGVTVVVSANAEQGMSQSLIAGLQENSDADAWMVALGDMPYLKVSTIESLVALSRVDSIVQPTHLGKPGNPVIFGREFYHELTGLAGDKGGRELIKKYQSQLTQIEVADPGIHLDIDRPEDVLH